MLPSGTCLSRIWWSRQVPFRLLLFGCDNGRNLLPDPHPFCAVAALSLNIAIAGTLPGQNLIPLVVEDEVTAIRPEHQHSMPLALFVGHYSHPHGPARQMSLNQQPALEKLNVLTVAKPIIRIVPAVDHTTVIPIRDRQDRAVYTLI